MNKNFFRRAFACAILMLGMGSALAEDIDIYSQNTSITPGAPNVLIVLDNTANWSQRFASSTKFAAEMTALAQVVTALKTQFNLGIMMFTETGSPNSTTDGGYVRFAIQGMTQTDGTATDARNCLLKMVGSGSTCVSTNANYSLLDINNDKSNGGKAGVTMGEVYDYFAGENAYAGNNKIKADPLAFLSGTIAGPKYKSPITESCQKNFVIVLSNGAFQDNSSDTSTATSQLGTAGGSTTVINPPDNGTSANNVSDEWVRFLNKVSSIGAVTYTLEVGPSTTGQGPYNTSLLQSMGTQGKGGYFSAVDAASLNAALTRIFNDIQAVNSVFASASLPLSSDNTGAFLNQVYMGVFRPDAQGKQRWLGNVKQYAFAVDVNKNLYLVDSLGAAAAGAAGFATPDAVSFWTSKDPTMAPDAAPATATSAANGSTGGFWYFDSKGSGGNFDSQDGEWVEKGGAAQQLRLAHLGYGGRGGIGDNNDSTLNSKPARQVLTCIGTCLTSTGTTLTASANRATTWFELGNTAIDSTALGLTNTVIVSSITNPAMNVATLTTGPSISLIHVANGSNKPATVTTTVPHGFSNGDTVVISGASAAYNGTWVIANVSSTTFQVGSTFSGSSSVDATTGTAAKSGSTKAFVTATAHGLTTGQKVVIAGATPTGFTNSGTATAITVLDANTFSYTTTGAVTGPATGTITYTGPTARATSTTAHGFANNASVTIAQVVSPTVYNGTFTIRNVTSTTFDYTYSGADPIQASATTTLGITATNTTGSIRDSLVRWVRGLDTADENGFKVAGADTDVRASIHGDVLHSRPIVLNYSASTTSNDVYVFYGGNDGIYRAIKGGQAATDGKEQWAFIPQEFFPKFQRMYNNSPQVLYPSTGSGILPTPKTRDYTFDGPVGSYIHRNSSGAVDKAILYIAVRRGGRFIYALDVTTPTAPKFLWKKGSGDAGFAELGQTWSQPVVASVKARTNPVVIFGAGYDAASEDPDVPATTDSLGRAIYVLDAFDGSLVWAAGNTSNFGSTVPTGFHAVSGMDFSIASDVQVVDRTLDGFADRIYAVDVGANVWRVDISDADPNDWAVWKIAALGQRSAGANAAARKLLFSPDVVFGESYDAIIVGTGDREHPLATSTATNAVANRFYMIKDTRIGATGDNLGYVDTCTMTVASNCSSFFDATGGGAVPAGANGWSVNLAAGEKVVNGPLVTAGHVIFGTNKPDTSNTTCNANLGVAQRYDVNYLTGLGAGAFKDSSGNVVLSEVAVGGGFLPSPVSGVVEINGTPYLFTTDNPLNPGGVIPITVNVTQKRFRTYWREKLE